jgi:hypothetical protein
MFCKTWSQLQQAIALTEMCPMDVAGNYDSFLFIAKYCMRLMLRCIASEGSQYYQPRSSSSNNNNNNNSINNKTPVTNRERVCIACLL